MRKIYISKMMGIAPTNATKLTWVILGYITECKRRNIVRKRCRPIIKWPKVVKIYANKINTLIT